MGYWPRRVLPPSWFCIGATDGVPAKEPPAAGFLNVAGDIDGALAGAAGAGADWFIMDIIMSGIIASMPEEEDWGANGLAIRRFLD
jgi:hypothetical protein